MLAADISFWTVIWYAIAGLIIGLIARAIMPGRQAMGLIPTILLGVVASIAGGLLWNAIFKDQSGVSWIGGVVVAVVLLWAYSRLAPRMNRSSGRPPA
jgi:uncharacterized membrane protein YeaQ/YmgE (transglycosylase-associated protein family)